MAKSLVYDDSNLRRMYAELSPKHRMKALKSAFRREANRVRKVALNNLRSSLHSNAELERGVRSIVYKRKAGFRVTVGTKAANKKTKKGERGFYISHKKKRKDENEKGKPVLTYAEDGTRPRYTKTATKVFIRLRKGHSTGSMKRYGFMQKTADATRGCVTDTLHEEIINSVKEVAKKYGCT